MAKKATAARGKAKGKAGKSKAKVGKSKAKVGKKVNAWRSYVGGGRGGVSNEPIPW